MEKRAPAHRRLNPLVTEPQTTNAAAGKIFPAPMPCKILHLHYSIFSTQVENSMIYLVSPELERSSA